MAMVCPTWGPYNQKVGPIPMRKRLFYWSASVLLVISVVLVVWQGSFRLSNFGPSNAGQTFIYWAVSTLSSY